MRINFTAACVASYKTHLDIPDEVYNTMNKEELVKYLNEHISEATIEECPQFLNDLEDGVTELDIISEEKEDEFEDKYYVKKDRECDDYEL